MGINEIMDEIHKAKAEAEVYKILKEWLTNLHHCGTCRFRSHKCCYVLTVDFPYKYWGFKCYRNSTDDSDKYVREYDRRCERWEKGRR